MLSYADALRAIFRRTDHERGDRPSLPYAERVWRLDRVQDLLAALGDPQRRYPSVHVAGTKGKGSTTAMVESMLRAQGFRTGMYTSPHLHTFRERIRVDGAPISEEEVVALVERVQPVLATRPEVTVFEIITAMAMLAFAERGVDWGVFEVGMGGRLDATNILEPAVAVITSVSMDHMKVLGDTLAAIAGEKAGIIKRGTPVVSAPQRREALEVIQARAEALEAPLTLVGRDWLWRPRCKDLGGQRMDVFRAPGDAADGAPDGEAIDYADVCLPLLGAHQLENATTAIAVAEVLRAQGVGLTRQAVRAGLERVVWPGRLEVVGRRPLTVVDGAHNGDSVRRLLEAVRDDLPHRRVLLVFGCGLHHLPDQLLAELLPASDEAFLVHSQHDKATPVEDLAAYAHALGYEAHEAGTVAEGLRAALEAAGEEDLVLVTGSLFVVSEAREAWAALEGLPPLPSDPPDVY